MLDRTGRGRRCANDGAGADATDPITITYTLPVDPTTADSGEQKHEFSPSAAVIASTSAVRTLAARSLIKELDEECRQESETDKKARIVSLGVRYVFTAPTIA